MTTLADMVLSARSRLGLTQEQFGERVGVSHSYIYNLEKGKNKIPSPGVMAALARVIGISEVHLLRAVGYLSEEPEITSGLTPDDLREIDEIAATPGAKEFAERLLDDPLFFAALERAARRRSRDI